MLRVLGRANSINVMKVMWCCEELGIPYNRIDVAGPYGFKNQPDYLDYNPNGRVPTIDDDGFILWESNVIVRYLSQKYANGTLYPKDDRTKWLAEQWMDWQQTVTAPAITPMFWQLVRTEPAKRDVGAIEASRKATADALMILDKHLAKVPYVAGGQFTMADIPLGCVAYRWFAFPIERPDLPNLKAWHDRLKKRPGYGKHLLLPLT